MSSVGMTRWEDFVQRVRRHRPSDLLPAIAAANIELAPEGWFQPSATAPPMLPWELAAAARESIRAGNEHRDPGVTPTDLLEICHIYGQLYDPFLDDRDLTALAVRAAYEQFPFQEPLFFGLTRSELLFDRPSPRVRPKLQIVGDLFWERTIGLSLDRLFAAGMVLGVGASTNQGWFDLSWYEQSNFGGVRKVLSADHARTAMDAIFAATVEELRQMSRPTPRGVERLAFNPLQARPFVRQSETRFLAPVPAFVFWRASAPSLYYMALEQLAEPQKQTFTDDVGTLFEDYVVRQAEQLLALDRDPPDVYPEIEYRASAYTTDVILVWPDFILLVEAKASRLTEESRMGGPTLGEEINRTVGRAIAQIETTAQLIRDGAPALEHIPRDRPIYGLIVTLEPYRFIEAVSRSSNTVATAIASITEFERFIADSLVRPRVESDLLKHTNPGQTEWDVTGLIDSSTGERYSNPMLDVEWDARLKAVQAAAESDPPAER
jgi:hypothetical protein